MATEAGGHKDWQEGFDRFLGESEDAKHALERLVKAGCDEKKLRVLLYLCSSKHGLGAQGQGKNRKGLSRKREALAMRIENLAQEIKSLNDDPGFGPIDGLLSLKHLWPEGRISLSHAETVRLFTQLPALLTAYAAVVREWPPKRAREIIRKFERALGEAHRIPLLARYVKEQTRACHYGELAYLLEAAEAGYGRVVDVKLENLAKRCKRCEVKNWGLTSSQQQKLERIWFETIQSTLVPPLPASD